jgi:lysophospholipase L1-like esterase
MAVLFFALKPDLGVLNMKKTRPIVLILSVTLTIFFGQVVSSSAAALSIMPLGDSITDGANTPGSYRIKLFQDFGSDPSKVVFLGSLSNGYPSLPLTPVIETLHEGHSGWTIKNTSGFIDTRQNPPVVKDRSGLYEQIPSWLNSSVNPNVILLLIGTNDINMNYLVSSAPDRLDQLITRIATTKPKASIIVGNLPPIDDANNAFRYDLNSNARAITFNATIPGIVQKHHDLQSQKVYFCDINSHLGFSDLYDGLHPNATGYNKMGDAWYSAIQAIPEPGIFYLLITGGVCLATYAGLRPKKAAMYEASNMRD